MYLDFSPRLGCDKIKKGAGWREKFRSFYIGPCYMKEKSHFISLREQLHAFASFDVFNRSLRNNI